MIDLVSLGRALSDPMRVRILRLLLQSEACVCELEDAMEAGQARLSSHLQTLRALRVVTSEKRGSWVIYRLADPYVAILAEAVWHEPATKRCVVDSMRLKKRLGLRVDGCCVLGAGQLEKGA